MALELQMDIGLSVADSTAMAAHRIGTTLCGKWRIDDLLGVGGMAAVYAATHRNGSRAAIKMLHSELARYPLLRKRFLLEGYIANAVGHDRAVKVLDDDLAEDGSPFLVTELLEGETLEARRVRLGGRMPLEEVLIVADQLLEVLSCAHSRAVVHRDLKPENLFLTKQGSVKVLDFGIARLRDASGTRLTQTGMMMGSPPYMAPEQARGLDDEVDQRSDLWSCGALMYQLLSGFLVHDGPTLNQQLLCAMTMAAAPLASVWPEVDSNVASIVDRALAFERENRWPDARTMREAVGLAYEGLFGTPILAAARLTVESRPPALPGDGRRDRRWRCPWPSRRGKAFGVAILAAAAMASAAPFSAREVGAGQRASARAGQAISTTPELAVTSTPSSSLSQSPSVCGPQHQTVTLETGSPQYVDHPGAVPSPTPNPRSACRPPYFIEVATGKKRWKLECL
jgi:serine/threonine protein kinase